MHACNVIKKYPHYSPTFHCASSYCSDMLSKFGSVVVFASPTGRPRYGNTSSRGAGAVKSKANVLAELVETQDTGVIDLTTPCGVHSTIHTCMDPFKDNPGVVKNWRALWRSLPAYLRQEALLTNAAKDVNTKALMALGNGLVKYSFLGRPVCRNAFMTLTGIGAWSLTDARKKAESGNKSCLSRHERGDNILVQNTSQPKKYLDARNWLVHYADTHAEKSPISLESYLPAGRKAFYHSAYMHNRKTSNMPYAALPVFLAAWRCECPWLVVMKSVSKFVKCNLCEYLKMQIDQTPRSEPQIMEILRDRSTSSCWDPCTSVLSAINDRSCHPVALRSSAISVMCIISKLLSAINDRSGMQRFIKH